MFNLFKKKYHYFVSYTWTSSEQQTGTGTREIWLTHPLKHYEDITLMMNYLTKTFFDTPTEGLRHNEKTTVTVSINNYIFLRAE